MTDVYFGIARKREGVSATFLVRQNTADEKAILEVWKKNSYQRKSFRVCAGDRWIDLGANIGAFSVYAARRGCQVRSYEAEPENARRCALNMTENAASPEVYNAAIVPNSFPNANITLYVRTEPMSLRRHSIYDPLRPAGTISVPAIRFNDLPLTENDAVKMNIEGAEIELLEGDLAWGSVRKFVFEYSFDKDPSIERFKNILARLRKTFSLVDCNKRLPAVANWPFYPPNIFVYCEGRITI